MNKIYTYVVVCLFFLLLGGCSYHLASAPGSIYRYTGPNPTAKITLVSPYLEASSFYTLVLQVFDVNYDVDNCFIQIIQIPIRHKAQNHDKYYEQSKSFRATIQYSTRANKLFY